MALSFSAESLIHGRLGPAAGFARRIGEYVAVDWFYC